MPTLFVGHVKSKADKLAEAAPLFAEYGAQAGKAATDLDAILEERRRYEEEQQQKKDKEDLGKTAAAADILGGWDKLSQDVKNTLPAKFGIDLPRDDAGNVIIEQSAAGKLNDMRKMLLNDPDFVSKYGPIIMGVQQKRLDPDSARLAGEKIDATLAAKNADLKMKAWQESKKDARLSMRLSADADKHLRTLMARGAKQDAPSDYYVDNSGKLLSKEDYANLDTNMSIPARQLTVGQLKQYRDVHKDASDSKWRNVQMEGKNLFHDSILYKMKSGLPKMWLDQARAEKGFALTSGGKEKSAHDAKANEYMRNAVEALTGLTLRDPNIDPNDPYVPEAMGNIPNLVRLGVDRPEVLDQVPDPTSNDEWQILDDQPLR